MNETQALVTGTLMGALMGARHLAVEVQADHDEKGNYLPTFTVTGRNTGTRLRVSVEVEEEGTT